MTSRQLIERPQLGFFLMWQKCYRSLYMCDNSQREECCINQRLEIPERLKSSFKRTMIGIRTFSRVDVMALKRVSIRGVAPGSLFFQAGRSALRLCKGSPPSLNAPRGGARVARDEKNATSRISGLHLSFDVDHRRCDGVRRGAS